MDQKPKMPMKGLLLKWILRARQIQLLDHLMRRDVVDEKQNKVPPMQNEFSEENYKA